MILSIASGKGGTGKTTISTNLAYSLKESGEIDTQILDCDVEEPNSHLFLKPVMKKQEKAYTIVPKIDMEKCTLCGKCQDVCRFSAITIIGKKALIFKELCHSCGGCFIACEEGAVLENRRELGDVENGFIDDLQFTHGRLRIGEAMSPPLIKKVRKEIDPSKVSIIDAPPGTSCPAIESMKNTDFVLMVTEPTPFGLHDLRLAVEAVKLLEIPSGLVINRADIGNSDVLEYAKKENLPVLMEIPFDRKIAQIYSNGDLIAEKIPEYKDKFIAMFDKIKSLIKKGEEK